MLPNAKTVHLTNTKAKLTAKRLFKNNSLALQAYVYSIFHLIHYCTYSLQEWHRRWRQSLSIRPLIIHTMVGQSIPHVTQLDPIQADSRALRLFNFDMVKPNQDKPFSSKSHFKKSFW